VLLEVARALAEDGLKLAVIENEIGEVGIDGGYVREQGLPVQELFGGRICCTLQALPAIVTSAWSTVAGAETVWRR
jgi:G3E family GTPase